MEKHHYKIGKETIFRLQEDPELGDTDVTPDRLILSDRLNDIRLVGPTPSRRQFLAAGSVAAAGLFIRPIEGFAVMPGVWDNIKGFFNSFGKNILFDILPNFLPTAIAGFAPLASQALGQVASGGFTGWGYVPDCFGNNRQADLVMQLLGLVGSGRKLNAAVPYLNKALPDAVKLLFSLPAYVGVGDIAPGILKQPSNLAGINFPEPPMRFLNAGFSETNWYLRQTEDAQKKFFLPRSTGKFANYAIPTMNTAKPLNESFKKPHFYESELGSLVLIDYVLGKTTTDKKTKKVIAGDGKVSIYVVPPVNKRNVAPYVPADPNFLADRSKVDELKKRMLENLAEGSNQEQKVFKFEAET